jgi:PAS domain S-box-containing protein
LSTPLPLTEAQVQFAAEFVTLVVTASAFALLVVRPARRRTGARISSLAVLVAAGSLLVLAAAAFAHGSLLVTGPRVEWLGVGRLAAASLLLVTFPYRIGRRLARHRLAAVLLRLGVLAWGGAGLTEIMKGSEYVAAGILAAGSLLSAATLLAVAQRSIAVKVAAGGATSLLLVVVVLALALSAVISSSVQHDELNRLSSRAGIEKDALSNSGNVSSDAKLVEADLAGYFNFNQTKANPLVAFAVGTPAQKSSAGAQISQRLDDLSNLAHIGEVAYVSPDGSSVLVPRSAAPGFAPDPGLLPGACPVGKQGLFVYRGEAALAASSPECTTTNTLLGAAIATVPLNNQFLVQRRQVDPTVSLALVSGRTVLAQAGTLPDPASIVARYGGSTGQSIAQSVGNQFVAVATLTPQGENQPLSLVLATPATSVLSTRDQLFRTLFLIAFGGTVLALGLAIFTGDRITAGLRRLTTTAASIQAGETTVRARVTGDDEVAALSSAFDEMLDSVAAQSSALQAAAEDEARLRNRLEAVVAGMTDALVAVDSYGRITDFNRAAEALTGVGAEAARGAPAEQVVRVVGEDGRPVDRSLFAATGQPVTMTGRVGGPDGQVPVALSTGALRGPAGELVGTVVVFRDLRREQEIEQMKTEFLSRVGHELRTPLTGIMGYADILLRRDVPTDRARAWYDEILQSARRLLRIVEMLEFFASTGAGRTVLRPEPVDVAALVSGITSSWTARLPPNLSLGRRIARDEVLVAADRRWLSLAIDELLDNAVKFSPEGGRIAVRVTRAGDQVEISVADQGMGMTPEQYEVVFRDFVQGDTSDTRRFGGLGLGLAVVRRVVEGLGGTIRGRSTLGRGTLFVISLPAWIETPAPYPSPARKRAQRPVAPADDGAADAPVRSRRSPTRPHAGS